MAQVSGPQIDVTNFMDPAPVLLDAGPPAPVPAGLAATTKLARRRARLARAVARLRQPGTEERGVDGKTEPPLVNGQ